MHEGLDDEETESLIELVEAIDIEEAKIVAEKNPPSKKKPKRTGDVE